MSREREREIERERKREKEREREKARMDTLECYYSPWGIMRLACV